MKNLKSILFVLALLSAFSMRAANTVSDINTLRANAELGDARSQAKLALAYQYGDGVTKDIKQAIYWYGKAAEKGDSPSQIMLASMYQSGKDVSKDFKQAVYWLRKAAEQGNATAQYGLGESYEKGFGVLKDEIEALAWYYLAISNGVGSASEVAKVPANINVILEGRISALENKLGDRDALAAQQRAKEIARRINAQSSNAGSQAPNSPSASMEMLGNGSGVFVSQDGLILTAAHVIAGASAIQVSTQQGMFSATVVQVDATNDVALLRCKGQFTAARVANSKDIRLGRSIFTIGFPQVDLQGFSPKLTKGEISSLAGMRDDPRHWQISAPIQPGNSGGPLFDNNGDIIGIVVSKLDEIAVATQTGNLTQNVNYALKSAYIRPLLEEQSIPISDPNDTQSPRLEDIAERVQKSVVLIITYGER